MQRQFLFHQAKTIIEEYFAANELTEEELTGMALNSKDI
jgi:hypothetical protein